MSTKIEIVVKLDDEDRKLLTAVNTNLTKAVGKAAPTDPKTAAKAKKEADAAAKAAADAGDDDFDADADADADAGEGEAEDSFEGGESEEEPKTRADVHTALKAYATAASQADAIALMKKTGGTDSLSKLKEDKFAAVITACEAAAKKAKKK